MANVLNKVLFILMQVAYVDTFCLFLDKSKAMQLNNYDYLLIYLYLRLDLSGNKQKIVQMHVLVLIVYENFNFVEILVAQSKQQLGSQIFFCF